VAARLRAAVRAADAPDAAERVARLLSGTYPD
jgi:hypothetical protein